MAKLLGFHEPGAGTMARAQFAPKPRKWPKQARSQATFDAILDATARILEERGYDDLTTNAVAERAMRIWLEAMFAELESREPLVRVLLTDVPFVSQLPVATEFPAALVAIAATGGREREGQIALDGLGSAYFLLANMLRGAYLAMLLDPPPGVTRAAMLDDLTTLVIRMLRE